MVHMSWFLDFNELRVRWTLAFAIDVTHEMPRGTRETQEKVGFIG